MLLQRQSTGCRIQGQRAGRKGGLEEVQAWGDEREGEEKESQFREEGLAVLWRS